jgi:hypothetical protein
MGLTVMATDAAVMWIVVTEAVPLARVTGKNAGAGRSVVARMVATPRRRLSARDRRSRGGRSSTVRNSHALRILIIFSAVSGNLTISGKRCVPCS